MPYLDLRVNATIPLLIPKKMGRFKEAMPSQGFKSLRQSPPPRWLGFGFFVSKLVFFPNSKKMFPNWSKGGM